MYTTTSWSQQDTHLFSASGSSNSFGSFFASEGFPSRYSKVCVRMSSEKLRTYDVVFANKLHLTNTPRRHGLADRWPALITLRTPKFQVVRRRLCDDVLCSARLASSSAPLRPSVHYPSISLVVNTSREVNEARRPHTCSRPCVFEEKKRKKNTKSRRTQNKPRNPQQPDDRDHLETACNETCPTR